MHLPTRERETRVQLRRGIILCVSALCIYVTPSAILSLSLWKQHIARDPRFALKFNFRETKRILVTLLLAASFPKIRFALEAIRLEKKQKGTKMFYFVDVIISFIEKKIRLERARAYARAHVHKIVNFRNSRYRGQKYREGSHTQLTTKVTLSGPSHLTSVASARRRVGRTG